MAPASRSAKKGSSPPFLRGVACPASEAAVQPTFLQGPLSRGATEAQGGQPLDLLSADFVQVGQAFRLGPTLRDAEGVVDPLAGLPDDQVVLIELAEGGIAIGTAAELRGAQPRGMEPEDEEAATTRGVGEIVGRLFTLSFGDDDLIRGVREELARQLRERLGGKVAHVAELGLSWLGTRLLLEAIEARRPVAAGLYRWNGGEIQPADLVQGDDPALRDGAAKGMLVFLHGTGSCTRGSFGQLASPANGTWEGLQSQFQGHLYGFEHHTFAQSPIENALQLARSLPAGARLHLVSHSRGGLVADLLCLESLDDGLIEHFRYRGNEEGLLAQQLQEAQVFQQQQLRELRAVLAQKNFRIERYVRVACPARGTKLLGRNLDLFLSGLLSLVGMVPFLASNPVYGVLKRLVLEIVKRRTHPALVPGLAAMLPDSPFGALLDQAPLRGGLAMATIAGSCEGTNPLQKLALLLSDTLFFERCANDLVVDTASMQAGIAPRAGARTHVEQARGVHHFHYFQRASSSQALGRWLSDPKPEALGDFLPLTEEVANRERRSTRQSDREEGGTMRRRRSAVGGSPQPVVVVIPDLLASHLWQPREQKRLWFDPADRSGAALSQVRNIHSLEVEAEKVCDLIYGDLCRELLATHRVECFAYDWRQPLEVSAERLETLLLALLKDPDLGDQPVRLLAHGMGGLVVRGLVARSPELWRQLIRRDGARLLMLGTPNRGTHHMVATLVGHGELIRQLARVDPDGDLQAQLDTMAEFPGALQLLPQPGWSENDPAEPLPFQAPNWFEPALWTNLKACNHDPHFGHGHGATPSQAVLEKGRWLWNQDQGDLEALVGDDPGRVILVNGKAALTPCALTLQDGHPVLLGTPEGDGMVTWRSAAIGSLGRTYLMAADHGGLTCRREFFPALIELLAQGSTSLLPGMPSQARRRLRPIAPEPVPWPSDEELLRGLVAGVVPTRASQPPVSSLRVSCHAMDLRFINCPLMVGHYEQDPIAAAEAMIDQYIVGGELSSRERLGVYAGAVGSSTVVLMNRDQQQLHEGRCRGAVVIGLGKLGDLSLPTLLEAIQGGTLRYLLQIVDRHGANQVGPVNVELATLLIGQNSTDAISIDDSVSCLVRGVQEANLQFARVFPRLSVRVGHLKIVEVFLDTAITATRALQNLARPQKPDSPVALEVEQRLQLGEGWRHRLDASQCAGYWPRLLVLGEEKKPAPGECPGSPGPHRAKPPERLIYSFLGERARAEKVPHPLQGELVEALVASSLHFNTYNPDLSRSLFQLLVPTPFKDLARRLDQLVLVLDDSTANLPWELLMADDEPIALKLAMVRQLQAPNYRLRVQQSPSLNAFVIGNPPTTNFYRVFAGQASGDSNGLASLEGASEEASRVAKLLEEHGYTIEPTGEDLDGVAIITTLYRRPYRVLHIAAHGVFEQLTHTGERRTGVVLSNGMLITVSEIEAMEVVPDLVFLNCCHLGTVTTSTTPPFNRLAASVASQLIGMGVRAVVACGWAVNDRAAGAFAQTFYSEMLANKRFGDAVLAARKAAHAEAPECNTWGAYQAYGDPAFLLEAPHDTAYGRDGKPALNPDVWVTPHELVARLQLLLVNAEETTQRQPPRDQSLEQQLQNLHTSAPPSWWREPAVAFALAEATAALGKAHLEEARNHYLEAMRLHKGDDALPVRAIEQLAILEARLGEARGEMGWLESALRRVEALFALASVQAEGAAPAGGGESSGVMGPTDRSPYPPGWFTLKGSLQKQVAGLLARQMLEAPGSPAPSVLATALEASIQSFAQAGADPEAQIHRLTLQAVQRLGLASSDRSDEAVATGIREATTGKEELQAAFAQDRTFARGLRAADALLALHLQDGRLAAPGPQGRRAATALLQAYSRVFTTCPASPLKRESALDNLLRLEKLLRAQCLTPDGPGEAGERSANQVAQLIKALQDDAPSAADGEADPAAEDGEVMVLL
jgi:hypothetical protein